MTEVPAVSRPPGYTGWRDPPKQSFLAGLNGADRPYWAALYGSTESFSFHRSATPTAASRPGGSRSRCFWGVEIGGGHVPEQIGNKTRRDFVKYAAGPAQFCRLSPALSPGCWVPMTGCALEFLALAGRRCSSSVICCRDRRRRCRIYVRNLLAEPRVTGPDAAEWRAG